MIEILQPGVLTTVQDLGRKGYEIYGIPPSGAFDLFLASIANHLVGNDLRAPLLEFALIGPTLKTRVPCRFALTGNSIVCTLNGMHVPAFTAFEAAAGCTLHFVSMKGWFGYLAVGGGLDAERTLGSASTYLAGRIGSRMEKGTLLRHGPESGPALHLLFDQTLFGDTLRIVPSLHTSHFSPLDRTAIAERPYVIDPQSNRMGTHLKGHSIEGVRVRRSTPSLKGVVQIVRNGLPVILGPEGPTTGGYPQIAILSQSSWTTLAGSRPGSSVQFEWTSIEEARRILESRRAIFSREELWQKA